jgi:uncharacterized membrane protein required for colicin V production
MFEHMNTDNDLFGKLLNSLAVLVFVVISVLFVIAGFVSPVYAVPSWIMAIIVAGAVYPLHLVNN